MRKYGLIVKSPPGQAHATPGSLELPNVPQAGEVFSFQGDQFKTIRVIDQFFSRNEDALYCEKIS